MTNATCPDRTVFSRLLMGDLPDEELALAVEHLEECESCLEAIREASANQPLPSGIRHWAGQTRDTVGRSGEPDTIATDPAGCSPRIDSLVVRLMELMRQAPDADTLPSTGEVSQGTGDPQAEDAYRCLRPPQAADELGRLGPYRVLKVLGQGGMGVVFQAQDMRLNRLCALKVMRPEIAKRKGMKDRFLREARAAAALECDYVLPIYQVDEDNGVPFIAMPFLTGMSLEDWLQAHQRETPGEGLPPAEILKLASDIANGLSVAHAHGMIHRDIKPANIWLDNNVSGRARILDFGLARFSDTAGEQHLTQAGTILGTPSYMAPEQAKSGQVDARADLFSLGVVLYRLCTGDLPFRGHDSMATLLALTGQHPPAPSQVNVATPKSLSDLVMRLLEKDPSQR
ncbi:MAG: serine/threonine-protein kinase, partial [Pirellulales bacterium]